MPTEPSTINVVALVSDLIFDSKISGAARGIAATLKTVRTPNDLLTAAEQLAPHLVLVDLNVLGEGTTDAVARLRQTANGARIICFASHVDAELMDQARRAGADDVMPRSRFDAEAAKILRGFAAQFGDPR